MAAAFGHRSRMHRGGLGLHVAGLKESAAQAGCAGEHVARAATDRRQEEARAVRVRLDRAHHRSALRLRRRGDPADLHRRRGLPSLRGLHPILGFSCVDHRGHPGRSRRTGLVQSSRATHLVAAHRGAGQLQRGQRAERHLLAVRRRSVPVDRRRVLPRLLPAGLRRGADGRSRSRRSRAMGPPRPGHGHPAAGLRRLLLVLRDRSDGRLPARPGHAQVRAGAGLYRAELRRAAGLRRAPDALRRRADPAPGIDAPDARLRVDVVG